MEINCVNILAVVLPDKITINVVMCLCEASIHDMIFVSVKVSLMSISLPYIYNMSVSEAQTGFCYK